MVTIGFNWKRATALAANTAMVSSLAINLGIKLLKIQIPFRIDAGAIALLVSLTPVLRDLPPLQASKAGPGRGPGHGPVT